MKRLGAIHQPTPMAIQPLGARASLHLMTPPVEADWFSKCPADGDMLGNDKLSNCVPIADYRVIQTRIANTQGYTPLFDETLVNLRYTKLTGYDPLTGQPDDGTRTAQDMVDWCQNGIQINSQLTDVPLWATVAPLDNDHLAIAIAHCGPCPVTFRLPLAAQDTSLWSKPPGQGSSWLPGTWGTHRVVVGAFIGQVRTVRTWGEDVVVHPDFWRKYVIAVDVTLSKSTWFDTTGLAPSGLDWDALLADKNSI